MGVKVNAARLSWATRTTVFTDGWPVRLKGWVGKDTTGTTGYRLVATADAAGATLARLRAGRDVSLEAYLDHVVIVSGPLYAGDEAPSMIVNRIADLFDVTLQGKSEVGNEVDENYVVFTIGPGPDLPEPLPWQITTN